jgi:hypothetical protein
MDGRIEAALPQDVIILNVAREYGREREEEAEERREPQHPRRPAQPDQPSVGDAGTTWLLTGVL